MNETYYRIIKNGDGFEISCKSALPGVVLKGTDRIQLLKDFIKLVKSHETINNGKKNGSV